MQHDFILLDRSGSMADMWSEALGAVNSYVRKLADDRVDTGVTLAVFDGDDGKLDFKVVRDRIIPSTWHPVTNKDAEPRGMTPLCDATGKLVALAEAGGYDKVVIIIMTDGHENASKEYSVGAAKVLLNRCRAKNWQVLFLGANFDNAAQAESLGATQDMAVSVAPGKLAAAMSAPAASRAAYAATGAAMSYSDEQKQQLATPSNNGGTDNAS
jgi:Mg-chelatase subunit ChlD